MKKGKLLPYACVLAGILAPGLTLADTSRDVQPNSKTSGEHHAAEVTPMDQSNRQEYLDRTATIRKELMEEASLSTRAKNVKIITDDTGTVYLRGEVVNPSEKQLIERIAKNHAGSSGVHSELTTQH